MDREEILRTIEGLQTVDTVAEALHIKRQSAINLLSRLKKENYVTVKGGRQHVRLYRITMRKQRPRVNGMFDIINKYSPMKVMPWYDHQVHGPYTVEDALVDAIQTKSFRLILASLRLFSHIKDWPKLYNLANKKHCWQQVGALYDVARLFFRAKKMPNKYRRTYHRWEKITILKQKNFPEIADRWKVYVPFNKNDIGEVA